MVELGCGASKENDVGEKKFAIGKKRGRAWKKGLKFSVHPRKFGLKFIDEKLLPGLSKNP